ncbi:MAG: RND transporter, partial [Steroidobacteraceae bacterium]
MLGAVACIGLAACAVGPDYHPPQPAMPENFIAAPAAKGEPAATDNRVVDSARWWRALHDRELNSLIDRAIAASPTLEIALDRLQQARAQEAVVI